MARERDARLVYSTAGPVARPQAAPAPPGPPAGGIRLSLDRRASGRVVTVVTGLPGSPDEVSRMCRELKAACGAGGTVKDGVLELQGDHRPRVEAFLAARGLRWKRSGG